MLCRIASGELYMHRHRCGDCITGLVPCPAYAPESVRLLLAFSFVWLGFCLCTGTVRLLLVFSFVYPGFCLLADSMRQHRILAGAVREIEMDLRIPLYLSDTSPLTLGVSLRRGHYR